MKHLCDLSTDIVYLNILNDIQRFCSQHTNPLSQNEKSILSLKTNALSNYYTHYTTLCTAQNNCTYTDLVIRLPNNKNKILQNADNLMRYEFI